MKMGYSSITDRRTVLQIDWMVVRQIGSFIVTWLPGESTNKHTNKLVITSRDNKIKVNSQYFSGFQSWDWRGEIKIERKRIWEGNKEENSTA